MGNGTEDKRKEQIDLIERYNQGDKSVEDRILFLFRGFIKKIAIKYGQDDELIHVGEIGLFEGIKNYDAQKCDNPEVYLRKSVEGRIRKQVRFNIGLGTKRSGNVRSMQEERMEFEEKYGRTPTDAELAKIMNVSCNEIRKWEKEEQQMARISLDADIGEGINMLEILTDGYSAEDIYFRNNQDITGIIENAEYHASRFGLDLDVYWQHIEDYLKEHDEIECELPKRKSISEKDRILRNIFVDTKFYWPFSYRLTMYISQRYPELNTTDKIMEFLMRRMEEKDIPYLSESIKKWFKGADIQKGGEDNFRDSMYKICFSMELNVEETKEFFKQVVLDKAFYIRNVREFVYYYCIKNNREYQAAKTLIIQGERGDNEEREKHTLHETKVILESLVNFRSDEKLLEYIRRNPQDFNIRNLTGKRLIDELIESVCIRDEEKIIIKKWQMLQKNKESKLESVKKEDATSIAALGKFDKIAEVEREQITLLKSYSSDSSVLFLEFIENPQMIPKGKQVTTESSMLTLIYGLDIDDKRKNEEIPLVQQVILRSLPNRQMRQDFTKERESYEYIRKTLIVLASYKFWRENIEDDYEPWINRLLQHCNFEELYEHNPFDWFMIQCSHGKEPLRLFRDTIKELV